jgi:acetyl-CoA C-acetyltransferase/3-oxo-5,6-didehydrosuberyl-CoA/3-oxoadipyl-CoA thiolase
MRELREAVIVDALRTPFGRAHAQLGFLREMRSDDMGVTVLQEIVKRTGVDPSEVDEVILGAVEPLGEQAHPARNCAVLAGFPYEVPGLSVERACVTAMSSVHVAALSVMSGVGDVYIAGGIDSMTHISLPLVTPDTDFEALLEEENTMLSAMNPNPRMYDALNPLELVGGITAEKLVKQYGITREEMDRWAVMSNLRAVEAQKTGRFHDEIVPLMALDAEGGEFSLDYDQGPRPSSSYEKVSRLPTPFMPEGGTITAAAASGAADGAAVCMVMSKEKAREKGLKPFATIRGMGVAGCDPTIMGYSVVPATHKALGMLEMKVGEIELVEVNEAFACIPIVFMKEFGIESPEIVNVNGGACAIGHPVGATGARLVGTLAYELGRRGARWGLATICGGYGQGGTTILEREDYDWGEHRDPERR